MKDDNPIDIMKEADKPTDSIQQKIDSSLLDGQDQLIKLGETRFKQEQLYKIRRDKEDNIELYINNLNLNIPRNIKSESYKTAMHMCKESNKNFANKYEKKIITTDLIDFGTDSTIINFNKELILDDILHLYYAYKLSKLNCKKLEQENVKEKEAHVDTQESYDDLCKESIELEESLDNIHNDFNIYKENTRIIFIINILLIILLSIYLFFGPTKLYNDIIFINYLLYKFVLKILLFCDYLTIIFAFPYILIILATCIYYYNNIKKLDS